ncbi:MFS transporter [Thiohalobacter thiocyanaticus]|uniref:MFS transporter n=1 Tax=Thiohalobacter thiocyanaticus TaxID=585455 RepID=A0A426QGI0_9GAMM|nr:MFS transporter [Thiohalobacter thiocyanaticus]RRQ20857.1 MFS transporter [Thiohalobacter thiocyanaticus]
MPAHAPIPRAFPPVSPRTGHYWQLSSFYLFYFASLGALVPYWGLYLKSLGFSATEIGELMAILMATKLIAPNIWGWIADHTGQRVGIIRMASLLSILCFAGVFLGSSYVWLALVMSAFSFFWNASLPQFEAVTLSHLGAASHRYSRIRLWGSVGFIISVALLGRLLDSQGTEVMPLVVMGLFVAIWLSSLATREAEGSAQTDQTPRLRQILRRGDVLALLAICFLMQASHGPYYTFFTLYMEDHGYSRGLIGQLWALGVIAEIGVFLVIHRWLPRIGAWRLLFIGLQLTTLRWLLIAFFPDRLGIILFAQTLHAASFGLYHAVAIHLVHQYFTGRSQGRGQALYSSLSFGAGGAVGSLAAGYLWDGVSAQATYIAAAGVSLLAVLISYAVLRTTWREADVT